MALEVQREVLARMLRAHHEDDLAERALSLSDDELARIGTLGGYYAFSEDALALGGSMGGTRALSLATIDVLENTGRDLRRHHTELEVSSGLPAEPDATSGPGTESFDAMPTSVRSLPIRANAFSTSSTVRHGVLRRQTPPLRSSDAMNCGPSR